MENILFFNFRYNGHIKLWQIKVVGQLKLTSPTKFLRKYGSNNSLLIVEMDMFLLKVM